MLVGFLYQPKHRGFRRNTGRVGQGCGGLYLSRMLAPCNVLHARLVLEHESTSSQVIMVCYILAAQTPFIRV